MSILLGGRAARGFRGFPTCNVVFSIGVQSAAHRCLRVYRLLLSGLEDVVVSVCILFRNLHMQNMYKGPVSSRKNVGGQ